MAMGRRACGIIQTGIDGLSDFRHGSVSGRHYANGSEVETGKLPEGFRAVLSTVTVPVFVVFSYKTPIAWFDGSLWSIPDVWYSRTTSNHQAIVRTATANDGFYPVTSAATRFVPPVSAVPRFSVLDRSWAARDLTPQLPPRERCIWEACPRTAIADNECEIHIGLVTAN